jgi:ech hydrogenase subunit D
MLRKAIKAGSQAVRETIEVRELKQIEKANLLEECTRLSAEGFRLVQICAINSSDGVEMSYSFGKEFNMVTLRCNVVTGESVPSVTVVWRGAFLYENEIKDLFGVDIQNISVDYKGNFYNVAKKHPFAAVKRPESEA